MLSLCASRESVHMGRPCWILHDPSPVMQEVPTTDFVCSTADLKTLCAGTGQHHMHHVPPRLKVKKVSGSFFRWVPAMILAHRSPVITCKHYPMEQWCTLEPGNFATQPPQPINTIFCPYFPASNFGPILSAIWIRRDLDLLGSSWSSASSSMLTSLVEIADSQGRLSSSGK